MRVAILGMGAIGNVLARALEGQVDLLRVDRTRSPLVGDEAPVDLALVATKTPGTAWAALEAAKLLAKDGVAITLQNGLGNYEQLAERLGPERAGIGVIVVGAELNSDGSLWSTGPGQIEIGRHARVGDLATALTAGGMSVEVVADPWPAVWRKVSANCALNPLTALFGCTNGELLTHPAGAPLGDELAREAARVATATGVALSEDDAVSGWRSVAQGTFANRNSMRRDVEARRETEIDAINGAVVRLGEGSGVAVPVNSSIALLVSALSAR